MFSRITQLNQSQIFEVWCRSFTVQVLRVGNANIKVGSICFEQDRISIPLKVTYYALDNRGSIPGLGKVFFLATTYRRLWGPAGHPTAHLLPLRPEVTDDGALPPCPLYVFMTWCMGVSPSRRMSEQYFQTGHGKAYFFTRTKSRHKIIPASLHTLPGSYS